MEAKITIRIGHFTQMRQKNYRIQGEKPENAQALMQNRIHISSDEDN